MVVEVTSHDADTDQRDRLEKREGYAAAEIPVYLLIDREDCSLTVHAEPQDGKYSAPQPGVTAPPLRSPIPWG
jgi:Uma2 family endonuclease